MTTPLKKMWDYKRNLEDVKKGIEKKIVNNNQNKNAGRGNRFNKSGRGFTNRYY